jgi:hypothetical protein
MMVRRIEGGRVVEHMRYGAKEERSENKVVEQSGRQNKKAITIWRSTAKNKGQQAKRNKE